MTITLFMRYQHVIVIMFLYLQIYMKRLGNIFQTIFILIDKPHIAQRRRWSKIVTQRCHLLDLPKAKPVLRLLVGAGIAGSR